MRNLVLAANPKENDCHNLVKACIDAKGRDDRFQFEVLLYKDYVNMVDASEYELGPNDLMAIMWSEPRQIASGLASANTVAWDASHKTNWLGFKYFDLCTMDDMAMLSLSLLSQGLQRHADNPTSRWIIDTFFQFIPSHSIKVMFIDIDGAPECANAIQGVFEAWVLDEWHVNQTFLKEFFRRMQGRYHAFMAKFHALQYDDDIRMKCRVLEVLKEACNIAGYDVQEKRGFNGELKLRAIDRATNSSATEGAKFMTNLIERREQWCR